MAKRFGDTPKNTPCSLGAVTLHRFLIQSVSFNGKRAGKGKHFFPTPLWLLSYNVKIYSVSYIILLSHSFVKNIFSIVFDWCSIFFPPCFPNVRKACFCAEKGMQFRLIGQFLLAGLYDKPTISRFQCCSVGIGTDTSHTCIMLSHIPVL